MLDFSFFLFTIGITSSVALAASIPLKATEEALLAVIDEGNMFSCEESDTDPTQKLWAECKSSFEA
jgi:hypothetical protein